MFNSPPLVPKVEPSPSGITAFNLRARPLFERALWQGKFRGAVAQLIGRSRQLPTLQNAAGEIPQLVCCREQVCSIPLNVIKGSVSRVGDFDCEFFPINEQLEDRWVRVASMTLQGRGLPPVELIRKGDRYYVMDGHHRLSVARALHYLTIEALIVGDYAEA